MNTQTLFYERYINRYSLSKTLRFALLPQGKTNHYIHEGSFLAADMRKATSYLNIKPFIDASHRDFIAKAAEKLQTDVLAESGDNSVFSYGDLDAFTAAYESFKKDRKQEKKNFEKACERLRKRIVSCSFAAKSLKSDKEGLFAKALFDRILPSRVEAGEHLSLETIAEFKGFTSYFTGFHENRKNLYTDKAQGTAIAYRLVNENFCKFLDNVEVFQKLGDIISSFRQSATAADLAYLNQYDLESIFTSRAYVACLTQSGIDYYNQILGGQTLDDGTKLKGLNEIINLHNQQHAGKKIPSLRPLYKQILSDRESISFLPEAFSDTNEVYDAISSLHRCWIVSGAVSGVIESSQHLLQSIASQEVELSQLFIAKDKFSKLSMELYGDWSLLSYALKFYLQQQLAKNTKGKRKPVNPEKIQKLFDAEKYRSLQEIQAAIELYRDELEDAGLKQKLQTPLRDLLLCQFSVQIVNEKGKKTFDYATRLQNLYQTLQGELECKKEPNYRPDAHVVENMKLYLDTILDAIHYVRMLSIKSEEMLNYDVDRLFYGSLTELDEQFFNITRLYDKVRNFMTMKPYTEHKIKLNFNVPTLGNGWDKNKEMDNKCVLFQRDGAMFLGVINSAKLSEHHEFDKKELFKSDPHLTHGKPCYQKMIYKLFPDVSKMIPKCSVARKAVKAHFDQSTEDFKLYDAETFNESVIITHELYQIYSTEEGEAKKFQKEYLDKSKDEVGYRAAVRRWIQFCMDLLQCYKSTAGFDLSSLKPAAEYADVAAFYEELNPMLYSIKFEDIPCDFIDELVDKGVLLLFKIHNKDYNANATGRPNLHTLYWQACFSPENLVQANIKLNGEAEIFYREASILGCNVVKHAANTKLVNRTTSDGQEIPEDLYLEICRLVAGKISQDALSEDAKSYYPRAVIKTATHDIIKDKRYTENQYFFHVPLTFNYKATGDTRLNDAINQELIEHRDINIIGIDRGERNLLYISVIDQQGHILEQRSLNVVESAQEGKASRRVDYQNKLHLKEKSRDKSRRQWATIDKIADLKSGYLSYVIHEICALMEKYQAIVVLEDLNFGFKRGRFKFEKQVYQKFEAALIKKLNYLVFKNRGSEGAGSISRAYQLTNPFESFQKIGKQNGVLYYLPAHHTSKIDPVTGFIDKLKPKYENAAQARQFFSMMDSICYNELDQCFDFTYDEKKYIGTGNKIWTVKSWGELRYQWNSEEKQMHQINVTEELIRLFTRAQIDYRTAKLAAILSESDNVPLLKGVMSQLRLILNLRYSKGEEDFILSPVACATHKGRNVGYDSRLHGVRLPADADANGAYNIARKALLMIQRLRSQEANAAVLSNAVWHQYVQDEMIVQAQVAQL